MPKLEQVQQVSIKIDKVLKKFITINGPTLLEVRIKQGSIKNLGRPKNLKKIKQVFMKN